MGGSTPGTLVLNRVEQADPAKAIPPAFHRVAPLNSSGLPGNPAGHP
jgi:hypothetical protein